MAIFNSYVTNYQRVEAIGDSPIRRLRRSYQHSAVNSIDLMLASGKLRHCELENHHEKLINPLDIVWKFMEYPLVN